MKYSEVELIDTVFRYKDEHGLTAKDVDNEELLNFARWFLPQLLQQTQCTAMLEFLEQMLNKVSQYDSDGYLSAEMAIEDIKKGEAISYVIQMIKDCQPIA